MKRGVMKRGVAVAIALTILLFVLFCLPGTLEAVVVQPTYGPGVTDSIRARSAETIAEFEQAIPGSTAFGLTIELQAMGANARPNRSDAIYQLTMSSNVLAFTCCTFDSSGCPKGASIRINSSLLGSMWWGAGTPSLNLYDGLTILRHEMTHALGMYFGAYLLYTNRIVPGPRFVGCGLDVELYPSDPYHTANPGDLMYPFLGQGTRKNLSPTADSMLLCAFSQFYREDSSGVIAGRIFDEASGNGLPGWTVSVGSASALTDVSGNYRVVVQPGTYTVSESPKAGWEQTYPAGTYAVTLDPKGRIDSLNFGNRFDMSCCPRGDMDRDGALTPSDAVLLLNCVFLGNGCACNGDLNGDGNLTPSDAVLSLNCVFLGICPPCP